MTRIEGEADYDYLKRKLPELYEALHRVSGMWEAMETLFEKRMIFWHGNDNANLTDKVYTALLQVEIETLSSRFSKVEASVEGLADKKGWHLLLRAKDNLVYESAAGEMVNIPLALADVLVNHKTFEGRVEAREKYVRFTVGDAELADIPLSLVLQLRESEPGDEDEDSGAEEGEGGV